MVSSPYSLSLCITISMLLGCHGQTLWPVQLNQLMTKTHLKFDKFPQQIDTTGLDEFGLSNNCEADLIPAGIGICMPSSCTKDDLYDVILMLRDKDLIEVPSFFNASNETDMLRHCADIPDFTEDNGAIAAVTILCFFAFIGLLASIYDVLTQNSRQRIATSGRGTPSIGTLFDISNVASVSNDCESNVYIRRLKIISNANDGTITNRPTTGDNMADEGNVVVTDITSEMTTETRNKEPNNRNDMTYRYMPRITHEAVNNMNLSVETFFVLRCGPYFVGIFLGYFLVKYEQKPNMNKIGVSFGWIICLTAICISVYLSYSFTYGSGQWSTEAIVAFLSIQRLMFAVGVAWIVFACCTGYGGFINSILSWVGWVPLARLSYTGYLVHPIIVSYTYYSSAVQIHVTDWIMKEDINSWQTRCRQQGGKFNEPTPWCSPMIAVESPEKPNHPIRICMAPVPTLNSVFECPLYPMSNLKKNLHHLVNTKCFTLASTLISSTNVEFCWSSSQQTAFTHINELITSAPVLQYFDSAKPVILQIDASDDILGDVLMQGNRHVAYTSSSMTKSQKNNHVQNEKECIAILNAMYRCDQWLYGHHSITIETDYKPLETIFKHPIAQAPKRLQKMLLKLPRYIFIIIYRKGSTVWPADTLSRAPLPRTTEAKVSQLEVFMTALETTKEMPERIMDHTFELIKRATYKDAILSHLMPYIMLGGPY
ncbi:hypothetical protein LSH36_720g00008 [Paralvinella palmiformis]|uniref:Reverse transcriptase/retrotransposon-derived protein RNase H-like domain-containing protein n=1 Tax=Paralvinella palmiformis TaxID=53620 RepID=A0AAD9J1H2_9ANNE|nr:hypothetical protein LSH36_720g00008 [Paralvinella palmiformis]